MHAGEGSDDTVSCGEVEKTGEYGAFGEHCQGNDGKPCRHACT
jgi:hypothetical protein